MANCHHRDLDETHYTDLSDESHFVMYNNFSHKTVHYLYNIAKKDGLATTIARVYAELATMLLINKVEGKIYE